MPAAESLGRCYVCIDGDTNQALGYYTLSAVAVEHAELPGKAPTRSCPCWGLRTASAYASCLSTHCRSRRQGFREKLGFERSPTDPLHLYLLLSDARKSLGE